MNSADVEKIVRGAVKEALSEASVDKYESVTLAAAQILCKKVLEAADKIGLRAIVAVSDAGGNPVAVMRADGAIIASYDIALNKSYTAVALKMPTSKLAELAAPGGSLYGLQHTNGGKIVIFGGGEPLLKGGKVVGGLGVSGGTLEEDTALASVGKKYWEDVLCR